MDNMELVIIGNDEARLNITWNAQNGDLADPIPFDLDDSTIRQLATEAVQGGSVAGIAAEANPDFSGFVVDRFPANETTPYRRVFLRPKTPFGA